ncbi:MAG: hypothetical protein JXR63_13420 [Spirochaetales bacterium]|nr:hypothetical protein [Spirochaetales bacterium]
MYLLIGSFIFCSTLFFAEILNSKNIKNLTLEQRQYYSKSFSEFARMSSSVGFSLAIVYVVMMLIYASPRNFMTIFITFCSLFVAQAAIVSILTWLKLRKLENYNNFKQKYLANMLLKQIALITLVIFSYLNNILA